MPALRYAELAGAPSSCAPPPGPKESAKAANTQVRRVALRGGLGPLVWVSYGQNRSGLR
jgi:hypothetical protein